MPTYAENANQREIASRRRVQDARDARQHRQFDLQAQDLHHKHDRPSFSVVGEGSRVAQDRFRAGWDVIWGGSAARARSRVADEIRA